MTRQIVYDDGNTPDLNTAFELWADDMLARNRSPETVRAARYIVEQFQRVVGTKPTGCYSPQDIRSFINYDRERGLSPFSIESKYAMLRSLFSWLEHEGLIYHNPFQQVRRPYVPPKPGRVLEPESIDAILESLHTRHRDWVEQRDHAFILTLLDTAMRLSEALSMVVRDGKGEQFTIRGKGGRYRVVFLSPTTRKEILRYLKLIPYKLSDSDMLWRAVGGQAWKDESVKSRLRSISNRVGIPFSAHDLRRSAATWMLRQGVDLERIRLILGHQNIQTTQRYLALVTEDLRRTHQQFSPVNVLKHKTLTKP